MVTSKLEVGICFNTREPRASASRRAGAQSEAGFTKVGREPQPQRSAAASRGPPL